MRPTVKFLSDELADQIVDQAMEVLDKLGIELHNADLASVLSDHGAAVDAGQARVRLPRQLVEQALRSTPSSFRLYNARGEQTHELGGDNLHFTPGSAALNVLDFDTGQIRKPGTADYVAYVKVVSQLEHIASQSTALIPADVPDKAQDSYRLFLSLLYGDKPVVTGTFTISAFEVMKDMLVAVRGSEEALAEQPLAIFSCCPTSPLKWSGVTSQNVADCARYSIPIELISMPLAGFMAPVTLVGTLVAHTAETLSGIVLSQVTRPGTPVLYGGSPAIFDVRYETTPMGAVETMMIDCAYNEIGKRLGLPTQAYISLSDAKLLDAQAGLESAMGATLAALAGINNVSGPGMLDFESCQSLEKLVLDNEICGMAARLVQGITPKEDFPALPHFDELLREHHLLISDHSRRYLREEHYFPGPVIDRANRQRWQAEGTRSLGERAHARIEELLESYEPPARASDARDELVSVMEAEVRRHGQDRLPDRPQ